MKREAQVFGLALQFMTRLPVGEVPFSEERQAEAAKYYPLVGVVVGLIAALVFWVCARIWPQPVAVVLALGAALLVTGGLHEDGLADTADGLGGGHNKERAMEIMRDSAIGAYGVLALLLVLALKAVSLMHMPVWQAGVALVAVHGISRYAPVWAIFTQDYAHAEGAKFTAPRIDGTGHRLALIIAGALAVLWLLIAGAGTLASLVLAVAAVCGLSRLYLRKLGGFTGDCLGATQQISEVALYLGLLAWL
ncbi:adenosylcobinamide-GDP ribazoletransferase [Roseobacteraceae bacterium S113]